MNIYEISLAIVCSILVFLLVSATPIDLEDDMFDREVRGNDLFEEDLEDEIDLYRRAEEPFLRDAKAAQWNKNFIGSSLDSSVRGFRNKHASCSSGDVCKFAGKKVFNCRCNSFQYCVTNSPTKDARCKYSSVGIVYKQ